MAAPAGYTFHYGVEDIELLDVTEIVYEKCVVDGQIIIHSVDDHRAKNIFNIDPVPCVQKSIFVTDPDGNETIYDAYTDVIIA
jgi:hypothetical protein